MSNFFQSRAVIWICVVAAVIAVGAVLLSSNRLAPTTSDTAQPVTEKLPEFEKHILDPKILPPLLPADLPLEVGAKVTQNYSGTGSDGLEQSTRVFETSKTLEANLAIYQKYFSQKGWAVTSVSNSPELIGLSAKNKDLTATVAISENSLSQSKTVSITISRLNPK